ncbi:hypothetical protein MUP00_09385 [Candidatus Bathyarchaeota archaeon]|nr:hypothetical protein [Candidatus Bathyarchaeota archaeon]
MRKVIARQRHECQKCKGVIEAGEVAVQGSFRQFWHEGCVPPDRWKRGIRTTVTAQKVKG